MAETRRKFDAEFRESAVPDRAAVRQADRARRRELGINDGTLSNWAAKDQRARDGGDGRLSQSERVELNQLRKENAELVMERDVLKRSVALWVKDAMRQ